MVTGIFLSTILFSAMGLSFLQPASSIIIPIKYKDPVDSIFKAKLFEEFNII